MTRSSLAGRPAPRALLANIPRLVTAYYAEHPDRGAMPAVDDPLKDGDVPAGAKAPDVPHPDTGR